MKVEVGPDAPTVGRAVRDRLDRGERSAAFVGDAEADAATLEEFVGDVIRDES